MPFNLDELKKIDALVQKSNNILIIPHKAPDGDTLGSALALYQLFRNMGKAPRIICKDPPPANMMFLPNAERVEVGAPGLDFDTCFIVDAGAAHLTGFHETHPRLFDRSLEVVNIDHHGSNDRYGRYNVVVKEAASATAVLYELFFALGYPIDRATATCLLNGIYTDTGSFMHSNTTSDVLRISARLLSKGADLRRISKEIFKTTPISTMKLWGRVLKNISQSDEGVTLSVVTEKDFSDSGADYSEMTGVVDYINSVPGSAYSVILTEREGKVKGSLRTLKEEVDVAKIASHFGGGGHIKAAGFTVPGRLEKEIRWKVIEK